MTTQTKAAVIIAATILVLICLCLAVFTTAVVSGAVSYEVGFYSLTQYTKGNNEWVVYLNETCEKKRPARRGRSHNKPEWTEY